MEKLIDALLGNIRPPEELDAYKIIENLFNTGNQAVFNPAEAYNGRNGVPGPVTIQMLIDAGEKAKRLIREVKQHPTRPKDDVVNDSNIASAATTTFNSLLSQFTVENSIPALKPKFLQSFDTINRSAVAHPQGQRRYGGSHQRLCGPAGIS